MSILHLTRGLPASGKTTWAREWLAEPRTLRPHGRVNRDDIRAMLFARPTHTWEQEQQVTEVQRATVRLLLRAGHDVVCDDTNLRPKYVREWRRFAAANGATIQLHDFPADVETCIARDASRLSPVGERVIRAMATKYMPRGEFLPIPDEPTDSTTPEAYVPVYGTPDAVIVDIDGTLAHKADTRDIYDLARVHEDTPNPPVVEAVAAARLAGMLIVFCSGREDSSRDATEAWLDLHVDRHSDEPLFMRAAHDKRRDSIVKRELFDTHIRQHYNVRYVLDDRAQVVEMWRSLGLTCFQVAEGDF